MTICPVCGSHDVLVIGNNCKCPQCRSEWVKPQGFSKDFPYPLHTILYVPDRFYGKLIGIDRYEIMGYHFDERETLAALKPLSYDGAWIDRRVPFENLYLTEKEAWEA